MKELLKKYEALQKATEAANEAMEAAEADPTNEEKDEAFDRAYKAEYEAFEEVKAEIVRFSKGKIDSHTAGLILRKKRSEFENLISRVAV